MSEAPDRTIRRLAPRKPRPDAGVLIRENRPERTPENESAAQQPQASTDQTAGGGRKDRPKRQARASGTEGVSAAGKSQIAVEIPTDIRERARTAYLAAALYEDTPSFSAFVAQALEAEIHRIEESYNEGQPLKRRPGRLSPGRPLHGRPANEQLAQD